ncbi:DUF4350 domain-containing protein [Pseudomonas stutzeri]|uniref:DUF4350 domain-containing protein n=1 Tax=Stutzerimonas stutzeri TaxID=316 RepID=UPI00210C66B1|nr:DUF4350 domain-containing protein [Stutzerimonas stutzeri]MCQ4313134.1 DUF4350 domain-containing protein [Stutzerimonas stutzeri]
MIYRRAIYLALAAVLLGALLLFAMNKATPYEEVIEHGPSPQVRSNPYLAAEHFLADQGRAVTRTESVTGLVDLQPDTQVLLLLGDRSEMTPRQSARLLAWVADGGHLVFVAERLWNERTASSGDLLLDTLNLQQYETTEGRNGKDVADRIASAEKHPPLTRLYLENENAPAYLAFDTDYHLYDAGEKAHAWANSAGATHMLQLQHGNGLVTALTDSWIWQNDNIARYDHAWLLWYLTQDRDVTLAYRTEHNSLLQQLLRYFPEALVALLLMLIFTTWHLAQRQGPLFAPPDRGRRQLQEHLRGSADFLYRHAGQRYLLSNLQRDILRQACRRHPGFETLGHAEQCEILAKFSRLSIDSIDQALRSPAAKPASTAEFTTQVARLQSLRNAL